MWLFRKKIKKNKIIFDKNHMNYDFKIGGGWGNHINWRDLNQFSEFTKDTIFHVYGHMPTRPQKGQTLMDEFKKSFMLFEFVNVEYCRDPSDMFFADVKMIARFFKEE